MTTDHLYKETLKTVRDELEGLLNEETLLESRLAAVRSRAEALRKMDLTISAALGEEYEEESVGITEAIRKVLEQRATKIAIAPRSVRTYLEQADFPLKNYKNPLAVIHTTLKRLEQQGEVKAHESNDKTYYAWIGKQISDDDIPF